ncbi:MAG: putative phage holin, partial [Mycobacterium sp.]
MIYRILTWAFTVGAVLIPAALAAEVWVDPDYQLLADVALALLAAVVTIFTIRYAFWSRWSDNPTGRAFLAKSVVLAMLLLHIVAERWIPVAYPLHEHVRFAVYAV